MLDFWLRVKAKIDEQNTKQSWLSEKTGIIHQTLSQWIKKDRLPNVDEGYRIAKALGVSVEELVFGEPPEGLSPEAFIIAKTFDNLSPAGRKAAQSMMEGLLKDYPRQPIQAENSAG
jgi:transcriptional regulator with XRE-family HTH domain